MVYPAMGILEVKGHLTVISVNKSVNIGEVIDKIPVQQSRLIYKAWLSHYLWSRYVIYDNSNGLNDILLCCVINLGLNAS